MGFLLVWLDGVGVQLTQQCIAQIEQLRVPMPGLRCMISILRQKSNWTDY
jgi:hypothetical protein